MDSVNVKALDHNDKILYSIDEILQTNNARINSSKLQNKTQFSLLTQIADLLDLKYREAFDEINLYRRELINGLSLFFKAITGNFDESDGLYYTECIDKIRNDEHELTTLMKNQISVMTYVIKNFNTTIQKP